ncbi:MULTISPECIES: EmrA/EmrK family multidrug efflux transporter periplasmic adaptor subunit [Chromobacterium]|uniref:EmrA/EmrK family multidrug efflux transporter periplasmic adaptor subunit n=2 Tax=Chromobacterium TaxID=535 RepID=A0ABS3GKA4_9NEIS|nr:MULTISPECIES: EmrA/EmrK family multidrug efflux transporter periplasmic adaptor subunit [Chromobacterium]AXT48319.1 EmrA/EmrK family multidrug efflux transporter periplasmic adaptor subunit [Chromobacterium rhizoryzae]MBK0415541.1 EmrA/EmrK family multidrug efflux transporter periplasmic adaptor subunit [Chromobacterium haemolyticum]MBO0415039.1 EmrA/EmrK family multidrug efflux transporter periplasmic adaptor subunit [Chromobacterium haemolyticum]MBO0498300.1 EmrA/EmrK family multidrug effl
MDKKTKTAQGRKRNLIIATTLFAAIAIGYGAYWALVLSHQESTDDAYVSGHLVQVTPEVGGTVAKVLVDDTQHVKAGQLLVSLDKNDAQLNFDRARNEFAQVVRQTRQLMSNTQQLAAQVTLRETELARADADLKRRKQLAGTDALSAEELSHANDAVAGAKAALDAAREQQKASAALLGKDALAQQPAVKAAASRLKEAWLALQRTEIKAPLDGAVARRNVQVGQRLAAGTPLMSVIPLQNLWVDANFKEGQLAKIRIGQPVELKSDLYGGKIVYHGKVVGLSAGTGSAFSLLPAQNATGNWIKVVQRVPVRIQLDPKDLQSHPLRVGLSMDVVVDTSSTDGKAVAEAQPFVAHQDVSGQLPDLKQADELVRTLLAANAGEGKAE